jgi:thioredoxin 1
MSSELIKHISDASFEADVLQSDKPVLVTKMNVDENRDVPAKFGIRGIPTLMLFKGGQLAATKVGALSKAQLAQFLEVNL